MNRIGVFGATGQTGRLICQLLLEKEDVEVLACARTPEKLLKLQTSLDSLGTRLSTQVVDVHDSANVDSVLDKVDLIVGATSQWCDGPVLAARAAESSTNYCGIYLSNSEKWKRLRKLHDVCLERGVTIVDDCGTHPGLPAVMIRWISTRTPLRAAWVGGKFDLEWDSLGLTDETVADFVSEIETADPSVFSQGSWKKGYRLTRQFDFGVGQGPETCTPMLMEEIREVVETEPLDSTGFYIAGFGPLFDKAIIPLGILLSKFNRRMSGNLLWWGLRRFASRPGHAIVQLDGERADVSGTVKMTISHDDPYFLTAVPVVATIRQVLTAPKPGTWTQAAFVEPDQFVAHLQSMGLRVNSEYGLNAK